MEDSRWKSMGLRLWYVVYGGVVIWMIALPVFFVAVFGEQAGSLDSLEFTGLLILIFGPFLGARLGLFVVTGRPLIDWKW